MFTSACLFLAQFLVFGIVGMFGQFSILVQFDMAKHLIYSVLGLLLVQFGIVGIVGSRCIFWPVVKFG